MIVGASPAELYVRPWDKFSAVVPKLEYIRLIGIILSMSFLLLLIVLVSGMVLSY